MEDKDKSIEKMLNDYQVKKNLQNIVAESKLVEANSKKFQNKTPDPRIRNNSFIGKNATLDID